MSASGKILFFTGGTALRHVSRTLAARRINTIHIVTPFDSGGSSAALRRAFAMPAVGDARNRILALAQNQRAPLTRLLASRLPVDADEDSLQKRFEAYVAGTQPHYFACGELCAHVSAKLRRFQEAMPPGFDLKKASIGNLYLAAGYLQYGNTARAFDELSALVKAIGTVRTVTDEPGHLCAIMEDGQTLVGQHLITGKETAPIAQPIRELFLTRKADTPLKSSIPASPEVIQLIRSASLIVYPPGSFYSSIVANLLPEGIVEAIAANPCRKLFIPNPGPDPETRNMKPSALVAALLRHMRTNPGEQVLNSIILDPSCESDDMDIWSSKGIRTEYRSLGVDATGRVNPETFVRLITSYY